MGRKSGIGRSGDNFDGAAKKVNRVSDYRQGHRFSFYVPKIDNIPHECDKQQGGEVNLEQSPLAGQLKLYDPVQQQNYRSQFARYAKAIDLPIAYLNKNGNTKTYGFSSCNSPTGFWEVVVTSGGTFVRLLNPILTIICPRPFTINELVGLETDSEDLLWSQIQGRISIIHPLTGEGSLDPTISIIGQRSATDPPILIRVELPNDPAINDILVIDTTATSRHPDIGISSAIDAEDPQFQVPCLTNTFIPLPSHIEEAFVVDRLYRTWDLPPNKDGLVSTAIQRNTSGTYENLQVFPIGDPRGYLIDYATFYRIAANYDYNGNKFSSRSCTFYFVDVGLTIKSIVADDLWRNNIGITSVGSFVVTPFESTNIPVVDEWKQLGITSLSSFVVTPFESTIINNNDDWINSIGITSLNSFQTDPLGGVTVG